MNDLPVSPLRALPDGNAELRVVLTLSWNDVASLGREAGRLATRLQRAVSLDEVASQLLAARPESATLARAARGNPALEQPAAALAPQVEQARQSTELMMRSPAASSPATASPAAPAADSTAPAATARTGPAPAPSLPTAVAPAPTPAAPSAPAVSAVPAQAPAA
ncbi:hypothetical protein GCM10010441_42470 [Kitasatospora paracochleata]|uniref:IS5 family transposase n=1 Tax=Kitasatospora paracochleata TaxID=58354 RepID=A0ABT1J0M2_9ACTN|nr:hypothetical protein [Kitasatospora paracochleata]MCP2310965.1 IS5 family transposase [Kitasatospora paracochleata]